MTFVGAPPVPGTQTAATTPPFVRRRRPLPGGRAVLGGFLVAVAVVGLVAAQQATSRPPTTRYVVAAGTLPAGHQLVPADLGTRVVDLPAALRQHAFRDPRPLVGRVLAATVTEGDLVQPSALSPRGPDPTEREVSFTVDPSRSLGQRITPGDRVDVYATSGQDGSRTQVVVRAARVVDRQGRAGTAGFIYTVALADQREVEALVAAAASSQLSLVRTPPAGSAPTATTVPSSARGG